MGWSILMAMVLDQPDERRRGRYMGLMGASLILGVSMGAPLGGYFTRSSRSFRAARGGCRAVLRAGARQRRARRQRRKATPGVAQGNRRLAAAASRACWCRRCSTWSIATRWASSSCSFRLYLETLGVSDPARKGQYLGLFLVPFAFLQVPGGWLTERIGPWKPLLAGSLVYGLALCTVGYSDLYAVWWVMIVLGVLAAIMFPPAITLTAQLSDPQTRGSAMGGFNLAGSVGFAIGPIAGVWAYKAHGFGFAFVLAGALEVLAAVAGIAVLVPVEEVGEERLR